jgi:hypothetical protein
MSQGDTMKGECALVNQIRELMEPSNPVPTTGGQGEAPYQEEIAALLSELRTASQELAELAPVDQMRDQPGRRRGRDIAWRVLAPVLSGLAVITIITSLTVVVGPRPSRRSDPPPPVVTPLPPFYVTINGDPLHPKVLVHNTKTKKIAATTVLTPKDPRESVSVAAAPSHRVFYLMADTGSSRRATNLIYRLTIAKDGTQVRLAGLPARLAARLAGDVVNGIAVSPDGTKLGVTAQVPHQRSLPSPVIAVVPLNGKGRTRVWSAPSSTALASDPAWIDNQDLAFLLIRPITNLARRTQERALDTMQGGHDLFSARVLIRERLGHMNTAFAAPHGGPVFATIYTNKPATGLTGVGTDRLVEFLPHKPLAPLVLAVHKARYDNMTERDSVDYFFGLYGIDASGQHVLVASPHLGGLSQRKILPLPTGPDWLFSAAW